MELLLVFVAGSALAALALRWCQSWMLPPPKAKTKAVPSAQPPASPQPKATPTMRINALIRELDDAGDDSAHPRDLLHRAVFHKAATILEQADVPLSLVLDYVNGSKWMLETVAWAALTQRKDAAEVCDELLTKLPKITWWALPFALKYFFDLPKPPALGSLLLNFPSSSADQVLVLSLLSDDFKARAKRGDRFEFGAGLPNATPTQLNNVEKLLRNVRHPGALQLLDELAAWRRAQVDHEFLKPIGRFLGGDIEEQLLVEPPMLAESLTLALACLERDPPRSMLVSGEPRSGKTSFVRLLATRISAAGWKVFEASGAALMAGQVYAGDLEERLRRLVAELTVEKKVLWYIPDFAKLAVSGMYRGQAASILDQILPALTARRIVVIGETSASQLVKLLQSRQALRSALELLRLRAPDEVQAAQIAHSFAPRLATKLGLQLAADALDTAIHLSRQYLGSTHLPGALLDLLKLAGQRTVAGGGILLRREELLATLSQLTGMPAQVLDDRERVDLAALRDFFERRVIGQSEAVATIVERIAMLKAGLTDPERPIGVFLFAGPTGTGKTELAKSLAEFLFGAADRLIRLDMSEYQTEYSAQRILGGPEEHADSRALTHRVQRQPFCVVLLDEFEKAHPNVWDLFLQVFDAGRLSDSTGNTVDFRHAIIILTSNLGATAHQSSGLGFAAAAGEFSREQVLRTVNKSFRPELVNRFDNVIVFQPLSRELMRKILTKELNLVLQRRGLRQREWAVEWEPSALDFLLDKGFSPSLGARPLKRAIDQHLLSPLAATLVEQRFPEGDQFLFVRSDRRAIQVEFVDPAAPAESTSREGAQEPAAPLAAAILQARGTAAERILLEQALAALEQQMRSADWSALAEALAVQMRRPDFWERADRHHILAQYALLDRIEAAKQTALGLQRRMQRSIRASGHCSAQLVARLAAQIRAVQHGIQDALEDAAIEMVLAVQPALDASSDAALHVGWCERLLTMYTSWAKQRHMHLEVLPGRAHAQNLLLISGFGAARTLWLEAGLHLLEQESAAGSHRVAARVRVASTPTSVPKPRAERYATLLALIQREQVTPNIVRRYRFEPSPLVRDVRGQWRTGRAEWVLNGQFDLLGEMLPREPELMARADR